MNIEEAAKEKYPFATTPPHDAEVSGYYNAAQAKLQKAFIAGAKWDREQMMKEAVEADVNIYRDIVAGKSWAEFVVEMPTNSLGDKVKIIIVKDN